MVKKNGAEGSGSGFELDTLDGFLKPDGKSENTISRAVSEPDPVPVEAEGKKKYFHPGLIAAMVAGVFIAISAIFFWKQDLSLSFPSGSTASISNHYFQVGPISTTLSNNDIIIFSLDIGCRSDSEKNRLAEKDSLLRNQIIDAITAPGAERLFEERQYEKIKERIRRKIEKTSGVPVGEVWFSELLIF